MFWRFKLKKAADPAPAHKPAPPADHLAPQTATELLSTPRRQKLLEHIWQRTSLSRQQFADLYRHPIERYAELVQQLPASENHHHAYPGGMLDHGLEIVVYALKIRQSHLLPIGATPETQAAQTEAWTATIAYAALLHDLGKIAVDVDVHLEDGSVWHPWQGPIQRAYRFKYRKGRPYKLHSAATGLLCMQVLPASTLDWLSTYPEPWNALIYVLTGQYEHAGTLGELVSQADQASVAQELGGNPVRALAAPKSSLQRRLIEGLGFLVNEQLKLNQPRASDGWLTDDGLWLVSKPVADKLRAHLLSQGVEGVPSSNTTLFNVLQDNAIIQVSPEGKAIWTATIQNGKWKKTLTFLKVAPALIWEKAERPPAFTGSVTLEVTAEKNEEDEHTGDLDHPASAYSPLEPTSSWGAPPDWPQSPEQEDIAPAAPPRYITDVPDLDDDQVSQWALALDHPERDTHEATRANAGLIPTERPDPSVAPTDNKTESPPGMAPRSAVASSAKKTAQSNAHTAQPDASPEVLGKTFMKWLRQGVLTNKIIVNDATAKVHSVVGTAFLVSPGIFQRYADEHPETARAAQLHGTNGWRWVQRCFEKLELHRKDEAGRSLWACQIQSSRKARDIKGYLLKDPLLIFTERPYDNPYLQVKE
ncbi:TraI domain-containing protein [Pseudomonas gingeri]|uniref:TraI domain-containing protein n=1 Tax=Pseudomonas gingeri TaxID=117681 RepID=A0A7Y7XGF4_9PSED|nr:MobH family relaxase [Pseudomonas gingeri]NWB98352.1 TraI domain-containing protein [Pseudomonas gingeri]